MSELKTCAACGSTKLIIIPHGFFACDNCGLGQLPQGERFQRGLESAVWIETIGGHAPDISEELDHKARVAQRILTGFHAFHGRGDTPIGPTGQSFEIGAGNGAISLELKRLGWDVTVNDASKKSTNEIQKKEMLACSGRFDDTFEDRLVNILTDKYDLIVAWDSMEHMTFIEQAFKNIATFLKPGGVFVMHSPYLDSYRNDGQHPHYLDRSHLWHLTPQAVMGFISKVGLLVPSTKIEIGKLWGDAGYAHKNNFVLWAVKKKQEEAND